MINPGLKLKGVGILEKMNPGIVNRPDGTGDYFFVYLYDKAVVGW